MSQTRANIWKDRDVAAAFLNERSLLIPDRQRQLEVALHVISSVTPIPQRILDLGTGDAIILATVLKAYPEANGIGLDFSPLMLEEARKKLDQFSRRASTVEADLSAPDWRRGLAGPFDVVVSGFAIHHLSHDRKRTLCREIFEILRDGGLFLNLEHVASSTPLLERLSDEAMVDHLFRRRRERNENVTVDQVRRDFLERPDRAANILAMVEDQCDWLREIGFVNVDCFWKYFELAIFGGFRTAAVR